MHPFALKKEELVLVSGGAIVGGSIDDPLTPIAPVSSDPVGAKIPVDDTTDAIGEEGGCWYPGPDPVQLV